MEHKNKGLSDEKQIFTPKIGIFVQNFQKIQFDVKSQLNIFSS